MNYRHAYHAGNFADCFKHALLLGLLDSLAIKPAPYFVLDTHAGAGRYDLDAEAARRTSESDQGIRRLLQCPAPGLERYLGLVLQLGLYPGSPTFIRAALRADDRLVCCELHPEDFAALRRHFHGDGQVAVHHRSGWEALGALLPPKERRGLVFIDPPFEAREEFSVLFEGLCRGYGRFCNGVFAAWYPTKQMAAVRNFKGRLASSGIRDIVAVEIDILDAVTPDGLTGCGLVVINPPYRFEDRAQSIANAVVRGVSENRIGTDAVVIRLTDE